MIAAFLTATAALLVTVSVALGALQILTVIPASGFPVTLLIIAAALAGLRILITIRKAPTS